MFSAYKYEHIYFSKCVKISLLWHFIYILQFPMKSSIINNLLFKKKKEEEEKIPKELPLKTLHRYYYCHRVDLISFTFYELCIYFKKHFAW